MKFLSPKWKVPMSTKISRNVIISTNSYGIVARNHKTITTINTWGVSESQFYFLYYVRFECVTIIKVGLYSSGISYLLCDITLNGYCIKPFTVLKIHWLLLRVEFWNNSDVHWDFCRYRMKDFKASDLQKLVWLTSHLDWNFFRHGMFVQHNF